MRIPITLIVAILAVEVMHLHAATIPVTSTADNGAAGTLRAALASAANGDTIDATGVSGTILLTSGELLVTNSLTIAGPGPNNLAVDGNAASRVFHVASNTVTISSLTITNGNGSCPGGGGIWNDHATLTVSNCAVNGNSACYIGGGIWNYGVDGGSATLEIVNSKLSGNSAGLGGGIFNNGGFSFKNGFPGSATLKIVNSKLSGNSAGEGGGIYNEGEGSGIATLKVSASTISSNSAADCGGGAGGGIFNDGATLTIANSMLSGNRAFSNDCGGGGSGGGIYNAGTVTVESSTLSSNSADFGGGIVNGNGSVEIVNSTLSGNSAGAGGGIYNDGELGSTTLTVINSTLSSNSAEEPGGAIVNDGGSGGSATLKVSASTLSGNFSNNGGGGGIYNDDTFFGNGLTGTATVEIADTILDAAGNPNEIVFNNSGTVTSDGYNLSSDDGGGFLTATGDQTNTPPLLGLLQDNGGPTFTHALLPGSPAIDAGDPNFTSPPDFDQRGPGFPRVVNGRIDIGAFEVQPPADSDGDGVPDAIDQCPDTPSGAIVDATGCSLAQLVPCDGPHSGGTWKSHGQYVRSVIRAATDFLQAKLITRKQWVEIVTRAAWSKCGWNRRCDHDRDPDWHRTWDCGRDADWGRGRDWGRD